jgi:hypothetical protein
LAAALVAGLASAAALAQPANDQCSSAAPLTPGVTTGTTVGATGETTSLCGFDDVSDVWYRVVSPGPGQYFVDSANSAVGDTTLAAFDACGGGLLTCNNDFGVSPAARISFGAGPAGTETLVRVSANLAATGAFTLSVTYVPASDAGPANDTCATAQPITVPTSFLDNLQFARGTLGSLCFTRDPQDVWYSFTPTVSGIYEFDTVGSQIPGTTISVFEGCGGTRLACTGGYGNGLVAAVILQAGTNYLVRVAGHNFETGQIQFNARFVPSLGGNDDCSGATALTVPSDVEVDTSAATGVDQTVDCGIGDRWDRWYRLTAPAAGRYGFFATIGGAGGSLSVFDSCSGSPIQCQDTNFVPQILALVNLAAGQSVLLRVATTGRDSGPITLTTLGPGQLAQNDLCSDAQPLTTLPATYTALVRGTTDDRDVECNTPFITPGSTAGGVWFTYTPPTSRVLLVRNSSPLDTVTALFDGCDGQELACSDPETSAFEVAGGTQYVILVGRWQGGDVSPTAFYQLSFDSVPALVPPANDQCSGALPIASGRTHGSTLGAELGIDSTPCGFQDVRDVWYTFAAPAAGVWTFDTAATTGMQGVSLAAYESCGGALITCAEFNADFTNYRARMELPLAAGQTALVRVSGALGEFGGFTIDVAGPIQLSSPPLNDECAAAAVIGSLPFSPGVVAVGGAAADVDVSCNADFASSSRNGVWYTYVPATSGQVAVYDAGNSFPLVTVFAGDCSSLSEIPGGCGFAGGVYQLDAGVQYRFLLSSSSGYPLSLGATFNPTFVEVSPLVNDACSEAITIPALPATVAVDNSTAQADGPPGSCNESATFQNSVWYRYVAQATGTLNVRITGNYFPVTSVYAAGSCSGLGTSTEIACALGVEPFTASVTAGGTYYIGVGNFSDFPGGALTRLDLAFTAPPCRADFDGNGTPNIDDIFIFLNAWFANCTGQAGPPCNGRNADINNNGLNIDDIFIFLNLWFAGC